MNNYIEHRFVSDNEQKMLVKNIYMRIMSNKTDNIRLNEGVETVVFCAILVLQIIVFTGEFLGFRPCYFYLCFVYLLFVSSLFV